MVKTVNHEHLLATKLSSVNKAARINTERQSVIQDLNLKCIAPKQ